MTFRLFVDVWPCCRRGFAAIEEQGFCPQMRTYLDYNASAPLLQSARDAMIEAFALHGNPSSVHSEGRSARKLIENVRRDVGQAFGVGAKQVVFTSGATECANLVLGRQVRMGSVLMDVSAIYASATEHPCVLQGSQIDQNQLHTIPVLESGVVDLEALEKMLTGHDNSKGLAMVAVMAANNETGVIQPVYKIGEIVARHDALLCVDSVQSFGRIAIDYRESGAHFAFVSSHKIGGPKGVGALICLQDGIQPIAMLRGGGQENYLRAGTENVAAIAGFGAVVAEMQLNLDKNDQVIKMRDTIEDGLVAISRQSSNSTQLPVFFGDQADRLPNTSCFAVEGVRAETALIALDLEGICVSSGSACSSGKVGKSHVLAAMGVNESIAQCALRVSLGESSSTADVSHFLDAWKNIIERRAG